MFDLGNFGAGLKLDDLNGALTNAGSAYQIPDAPSTQLGIPISGGPSIGNEVAADDMAARGFDSLQSAGPGAVTGRAQPPAANAAAPGIPTDGVPEPEPTQDPSDDVSTKFSKESAGMLNGAVNMKTIGTLVGSYFGGPIGGQIGGMAGGMAESNVAKSKAEDERRRKFGLR